MDMTVAGSIGISGAGASTFCQIGPAYRTRTNGDAWSAWTSPGWQDAKYGVQNSLTVAFPINADAFLTGDMDLQIGIRMQTLNGGTATIVSGGFVWARIFNA